MKFYSIVLCFLFLNVSTFRNHTNNTTSSQQKCSAILSVEKDRHYRSASINDGTSFNLTLTNSSKSTQSYILNTKQLSQDCSNSYYKRKENTANVDLNIDLNFSNSKKITNNEITLNSGETLRFKLLVNVPKNTKYNHWSCIAIEALSTNCNTISAETILSVYVSNPNEE